VTQNPLQRFNSLTLLRNTMIGTGILKGMAVTARNFVGSYFDKERLITVQYPEERNPLPENYRNFPFLVYDGDDSQAGLRCVACKICEKECPPQCIYIVKSEDKKPDYMGKPQFYPKVFDIDISVCMSCQICVEVCPFEAIKMDKEFELSKRERFDALSQWRRVDVEATDQGDQIGDHNTFAELVDDAHRRIGAGANAYTIGIFATIANDVESHIAARRFDARIHLARGRPELARHFRDRRSLRHHLQTLA